MQTKLRNAIESKLAESVSYVDARKLRWVGYAFVLAPVVSVAVNSHVVRWIRSVIAHAFVKLTAWFKTETRAKRAKSRRWAIVEKYWAYANAGILYVYGIFFCGLGLMHPNLAVAVYGIGVGLFLYCALGYVFQTLGDKANDALTS